MIGKIIDKDQTSIQIRYASRDEAWEEFGAEAEDLGLVEDDDGSVTVWVSADTFEEDEREGPR